MLEYLAAVGIGNLRPLRVFAAVLAGDWLAGCQKADAGMRLEGVTAAASQDGRFKPAGDQAGTLWKGKAVASVRGGGQ